MQLPKSNSSDEVCFDKKSPANKGGAKVSVIRAIPLVEGAVTLAVFEFQK
jgi:hypothetical protein